MKRVILPLLTIFIFIFESSLVELLPADVFKDERMIVPRFLLILILFITAYYSKPQGIILGIVFGLLYDIVYTEILGVYLFCIPLLAYLLSKVGNILQSNIVIISILNLIGIVILEFFVYWVNLLIGSTEMQVELFLQNRLLPTVIFNLIFIIIFSYPLKRFLVKLKVSVE